MQERNSKGFIQHEVKEFSIKPVCDSRMNHLKERERMIDPNKVKFGLLSKISYHLVLRYRA
jgi:hypothetical protein